MNMKKLLLFIAFVFFFFTCQSQTKNNYGNTDMSESAVHFLQSLTSAQKEKAQLSFDNEDRYHWHYVPMERKGIPLKELTDKQVKIAMDILHTALSDTGFDKTMAIIQLENVLREIENAGTDYRNQVITIFQYLEILLTVFGDGDSKAIMCHLIFSHKITG